MVENGSRFGGSEKRLSIYKEHKAYQGSCNDPKSPSYIKKISAGPMVLGTLNSLACMCHCHTK
jgi:hypothetical protein